MALIDDVKAICDRLAPLGWGDLLKAATTPALDIAQKTPQALQKALELPLTHIDRTLPGFEDFNLAGARGITAGDPSQSLLYHALASPRVVQDANGALLKGWPTLREIETVENFIPRFRLLPLKRRNFFFVTGEDSAGLRRREENPQWGRLAAE